jgi:hypothetical protein
MTLSREFGDILGEVIVKTDLALFGKLQNRNGRQILADRIEVIDSIGGCSDVVFQVCKSISFANRTSDPRATAIDIPGIGPRRSDCSAMASMALDICADSFCWLQATAAPGRQAAEQTLLSQRVSSH